MLYFLETFGWDTGIQSSAWGQLLVANKSNIIFLRLFSLLLLGQVLHSQLYVAASCHPDYQISMTENSCFNFFFRRSSLKTLIIFLNLPFQSLYLRVSQKFFHLEMLLPESSDFLFHWMLYKVNYCAATFSFQIRTLFRC